MEKVNKYLKIILIIAIIAIPIFLLITLFAIFTDFVTAVKVNSSNEKDIISLVNKYNITVNGNIELIGLNQKFGDWDLYIRYKDGNADFKSFNDR